MYLGIDLGTSNSAIVGNTGSELRLFKTAEGTDVLPSVININRQGHRFVGNRAYQQALLSPENVAQGFKRLMGTDSPVTFAASGLTMTPEECSAEIIRTLLGQAKTEAGDVAIDGAVVTIPAAFNQMQSEATLRAAGAAGLERVGLLQEPIAAAMASIAQSRSRSGQFLVYDLGGGTFDVALVQSVGATVSVVAHEGINMLGGRDFDRGIVSAVVRPWLSRTFALPPHFQADPKYRRLIAIARVAVEKAKIELSTAEKAIIFAGEEETRIRDESGQDVYLSIDFTRAELERLIEEQIADSIALCRKVIKDNGYSPEDIDRLVLIGGPSKMPGIRNRIPRELGVPVDLQTDPMTAVAFGAAIFAESRDWGAATKSTTRKAARGSATTKDRIEVRYDYTVRTPEDRVRIRIRPVGDATGYRLQIDSRDGWSSGIVDLRPELSIEVPLAEHGENRCRVTVYDSSGAPLPGSETVLTINRTHASAAAIPATQTVSVKVVAQIGAVERNVLEPLVEKGTALPAEGTKTFRAAHDLKGGEASEIAIDLYQQAEGVPEPELNLFVGSFIIWGHEDLEPGDTLRRGEEVVIRWKMDDNGILNCAIDLPSLGRTFDTDKFYASAAGHRNFEGEQGAAIAAGVLRDAENDLTATEELLDLEARASIAALRQRVERQRHALSESSEADVCRSVTEQGRAVRQQVSRLRHAPENREMVLRQELNDLQRHYASFGREEADPRVTEIFDRLGVTALSALRSRNFDEVERAIHEMRSVAHRELSTMPRYVIHIFRKFVALRHMAIDRALHDRLCNEGEAAVTAGDINALRRLSWKFSGNLFSIDSETRGAAALAGLMRG